MFINQKTLLGHLLFRATYKFEFSRVCFNSHTVRYSQIRKFEKEREIEREEIYRKEWMNGKEQNLNVKPFQFNNQKITFSFFHSFQYNDCP